MKISRTLHPPSAMTFTERLSAFTTKTASMITKRKTMVRSTFQLSVKEYITVIIEELEQYAMVLWQGTLKG